MNAPWQSSHAPGMLERLDARDRALFARWRIGSGTSHAVRRLMLTATTLGGAGAALSFALFPMVWDRFADAGSLPLGTLVCSHLLVQVLKRTIGRPRPSRTLGVAALLREPDRFSFPSGHAAAAMSIAWGYGVAFPGLASVFGALAVFVGFTRVCLGVHYPGDVAAGQALALLTGCLLLGLR